MLRDSGAMVSTRNLKTMKHTSKIISSLLAACLIAQAYGDIPKKPPLTRYTGLWSNSPFTSKPAPETVAAVNNPLEDFTLTGIAPVPGGYRITIVNKKNPEDKHVIEPGGSSDFKLVSVNRNPEVSLGTKVVLSAGGTEGTVSFEPDLISLKAAPQAPAPNPAEQGQQGNQNPTPAQLKQAQAQAQQQKPATRIVPPPNGANAGGNSGNRTSGESRTQRRNK